MKPQPVNKSMVRFWSILSGVVLFLIFLLFLKTVSSKNNDTFCKQTHSTHLQKPVNLQTALDFYNEGNYQFEIGKCKEAIVSYTKAIQLDPDIPQEYNNRAYAFMRLQDYAKALPDLDKAIQLRPDYVEALMNRGDIHNYYYKINRQSALRDYNAIIATGNTKSNSVCGHRILAKDNGWHLKTFFDVLIQWMNKGYGCSLQKI